MDDLVEFFDRSSWGVILATHSTAGLMGLLGVLLVLVCLAGAAYAAWLRNVIGTVLLPGRGDRRGVPVAVSVLRFVPAALVMVLAGVAVLLCVTGHVVVGAVIGAFAFALLILLVLAWLAAPATVDPGPYVERETSLW